MAKRGAHEGSIFKRANGAWGAALQVNGKRKFVYAATRREVQEKLQALQREVKAGTFAPGALASGDVPKTVGDFLKYWLNHVAKLNVRPRTWEHYELCVRRMLTYIGGIKLGALTPHQVRAMYAHMQENGQLASRTVRHCHAVLHSAFNEAALLHYVERSPMAEITPPRVPRHEMRTLSREQVRALLDACKGTRWHGLWAVLVSTGLRLGEVLALRWHDLDLARIIHEGRE
jgi:integrase